MYGGAGVGKTHGVLDFALRKVREVPGFRVLVSRYEGAGALWGSQEFQFCELAGLARSREHRYGFPGGGYVDFMGFWDDRWMSRGYDLVVLSGGAEKNPIDPRERALEWAEQEQRWVWFLSRVQGLRTGGLGKPGLAVVETIPGPSDHWLKKRMDAGLMAEVKLGHEDNPATTTEYLELLKSIDGPQFRGLVHGRWNDEAPA